MSPDVFREALRSMHGWPGVVAMFGGNPCASPHFDELCAIMREEIPNQRQRGLWTNNFLGHGPAIRETFYPYGRSNVNVHLDREAAAYAEEWWPTCVIRSSIDQKSWHGPVMMDRKDMGIPDEDWESLRESCDINRNWSGIIVERDGRPVAYFCEIASALDGVRGEDHGIPATPGWWRQPMSAFTGQVLGCCDRGCGVPLRRKGHLDLDFVYDVSESWVRFTKPMKGKVEVEVHTTMPEGCAILTDYQRLRS